MRGAYRTTLMERIESLVLSMLALGPAHAKGRRGVGSVAGRIAYPVYASVLLHLSSFSKCELSAHLQQHHLSIQCQRKGDFLSSSLTASPPERVALTRKQSNLGPEKNPIFLLSQDQASTKSGLRSGEVQLLGLQDSTLPYQMKPRH